VVGPGQPAGKSVMPGFGKRVLVWSVERTVEAALFAVLLFAIYGDEHHSEWRGMWGNLLRNGGTTFVAMGYSGYGITTWILAVWGLASSRMRMITNVAIFVVCLSVWLILLEMPKAIPVVVIGAGFVALASYVATVVLRAISGRAQATTWTR
jgi:hypothetical protein